MPLLASAGILGVLAAAPRAPAALGLERPAATIVEAGPWPRRIATAAGEEGRIAAPPRRIVSAVLSADEILTALVEPERLAGVTHLADDSGISNCADSVPPGAARIGADVETILSLEPDLVFVARYTRAETVRLLAAAGVPVVRLGGYTSFAGIAEDIRTAGAAVGEETRAAAIVAEMNRRIAAVEAAVEAAAGRRPRVLYISPNGFTSGAGTTIDEMIERAGGRNVIREVGLVGPTRIPLEVAIGLEPDVILVSAWRSGGASADPAAEVLADPLWRDVPAVRAGRVHAIRGAWLTSVSQYPVRGLEEIARRLHPEAFGT